MNWTERPTLKEDAECSEAKAAGKLGIILEMAVQEEPGKFWVHASIGLVVDHLAGHWEQVLLCAPCRPRTADRWHDYCISSTNIQLVPQPYWARSFEALGHPAGIVRAYWKTCRGVDSLFIRGMCPFILSLYLLAALHRCRVCHWIVGNPIGCLRANPRHGVTFDKLSILYAWFNQTAARIGRRITNGTFLCNGSELAQRFRSPATVVTVSSSLTQKDFFAREDTCQGETIRVLYVGFVRPEKGLEYLIKAVTRVSFNRPWQLVIVGPWDEFPKYKSQLDETRAQDRDRG